MKILIINSVCGYGSTGKIVLDLYDCLTFRNQQCCIAYGRGKTVKGIKAVKIGIDLGVNLHGIMSRITDRHGFYSTIATNKLVKFIEEYHPDVIHLHNLHGYFINIKILFKALKQLKIPTVWTLHDCWAFTGHCSHFTFEGCNSWKVLCKNCPQKNEYPKSLFWDSSRKNFSQKKELFTSLDKMIIVTPSKWLKDIVLQSFLKNYPVKVICNGINVQIFRPRKNTHLLLGDKKILLGVSNIWNERKGFSVFLELSDQLPDDYVIVLVGVSKQQMSVINQKSNIIGIERTNNMNELAELYSDAYVYINPTFEDNFPTTNLEALACGTPIITFQTGGSTECLEGQKKVGVIAKQKTVKGILYAIHDIEKAMPSVEDCMNVGNRFNREMMLEEYMKLYNEILNK